jgi:hypothetical protein
MLIVPYFPIKDKTLWVFLSGGTAVWETDEAKCSEKFIVDNYLTPNGLFGKVKKFTKTTLFFELDNRTNINNFYTWSEFLEKEAPIPNVDIFRPFIWLGDVIGERDEWGWYEVCEEVYVGKIGLIDLWVACAR